MDVERRDRRSVVKYSILRWLTSSPICRNFSKMSSFQPDFYKKWCLITYITYTYIRAERAIRVMKINNWVKFISLSPIKYRDESSLRFLIFLGGLICCCLSLWILAWRGLNLGRIEFQAEPPGHLHTLRARLCLCLSSCRYHSLWKSQSSSSLLR